MLARPTPPRASGKTANTPGKELQPGRAVIQAPDQPIRDLRLLRIVLKHGRLELRYVCGRLGS